MPLTKEKRRKKTNEWKFKAEDYYKNSTSSTVSFNFNWTVLNVYKRKKKQKHTFRSKYVLGKKNVYKFIISREKTTKMREKNTNLFIDRLFYAKFKPIQWIFNTRITGWIPGVNSTPSR